MNDHVSKQVRALYLQDSRDRHLSVITNVGSGEINKKNYNWIQLEETIFHPKGGGQPSDEGLIAGIKVAYVHKELLDKNHLDKFEIYHCFEAEQPFNFKVGDEVEMLIDASLRSLHARLHTAGHVLAEAVNKCFPELEGYQGNHYSNNSYVKFKIHAPMATESKDEIKRKAEAEFNSWIEQNIAVEDMLEPSGLRTVKVYKNWSPCGGTHVKSLREIGRMEISDLSINKKEGTITIKYCL
jgi:Ser-tRNA(Ala) deacylase AlaX